MVTSTRMGDISSPESSFSQAIMYRAEAGIWKWSKHKHLVTNETNWHFNLFLLCWTTCKIYTEYPENTSLFQQIKQLQLRRLHDISFETPCYYLTHNKTKSSDDSHSHCSHLDNSIKLESLSPGENTALMTLTILSLITHCYCSD